MFNPLKYLLMKTGFMLTLCVLCLNLFGQSSSLDSTAAAYPVFPTAYEGKWSGQLAIFTARGKVQSVPMQLHILPIDDTTFTYTIYYGADLKAGKRDYLLRKGRRGDNHWVIDEQDGILLDNFYLGGVLHGPFSVSGNALTSSLELRGDQLIYNIISGPIAIFRASEATSIESGKEEVYEVKTFQIRNFQRAFLNRL